MTSAPATILLVDDIAANRETLRELLSAENYRFIEAADGPTALRLAAETPPDLVLLDVMMPGMDGYEVCRRLRAETRFAEVPVIIVTALDDHASRITAIEAGADEFVTKPFNRVELRARVRTTTRLNRYRLLAEARTSRRASEERYRELFNTIDEGFCIIEIRLDAAGEPDDFRFLEVNPSFERQSGLRDATGKWVRELIPNIEAGWIRRFGKVALTGESVRFANSLGALNRWFDVSAYPVERPQGRNVAILFSDVTARVAAEQTLRAGEERFRALFELGPVAVYSCDAAGRLQEFNRRAVELWGREPEPAAEAERFCGAFKLFRADGTAVPQGQCPTADVVTGRIPEAKDVEMLGERADGSRINVIVNVVPLRNKEGAITGAIGCFYDITTRKAADAALRESAQWLKAIFEQAAVGVVQADAITRRFVRFNQHFCEFLGYMREELAPLSYLAVTHQQDLETDLAGLAQLLDGTLREFTREKRFVRKDGSTVWASVAMSSVGTPGALPSSFIVVVQDISERMQAREQILRAQRLDNLGLLAAGIAHDFNNALAPIKLAGPVLRQYLTAADKPHPPEAGAAAAGPQKNAVDPRVERLLNIMEQCTERGAALVRQLLSFARGAGGERQLLRADRLLREVGELAEATLAASIRVKIVAPAELCPIYANATQIHQVFLNLCVNARDAMAQGGELTITATNRTIDAAEAATIPNGQAGNFLAVEVKDTGDGIAPDAIARIWEPFFTTKGADKGTGLGLSTVRGIVQQHGGFVTVRTHLHRGTTFTVFLPAGTDPLLSKTELPHAEPARGRNELILVVDDDENVRLMATQILNGHGYRTITACDGADAIVVFAPNAAEVRLLLTDLQMPLLGGPALASALHRLRADLPVIAMSGSADPGSRASTPGFTAYLAKPFQAETLLSIVRTALDESPLSAASQPVA